MDYEPMMLFEVEQDYGAAGAITPVWGHFGDSVRYMLAHAIGLCIKRAAKEWYSSIFYAHEIVLQKIDTYNDKERAPNRWDWYEVYDLETGKICAAVFADWKWTGLGEPNYNVLTISVYIGD